MVEEAIESVLAQTLDDVEVVVVDDGSVDGSGDILKDRFGDRIRYFYQENQGRSVARNRGTRISTGEYLVFLDSDDLLLPQGLETMASFLDSKPDVDVVYADGYYCDEEGHDIELVSKGRPSVDLDNMLETLVLHNVIGSPHLAMVRRSSLEGLGYPYFDETLRGTEDTDFWLRLSVQGARFACLDVPVGKYRLHKTNASKKYSPNWDRRWQSLLRGRRKVLQAGFFSGLSSATRRKFLYNMLLVTLRDDVQAQEEILQSPQFRALPPSDQASLLYYVGTDNIKYHRLFEVGRERLRQSVRVDGKRAQYRFVLFLAELGEPIVRAVLSVRRKLGKVRRRGTIDYSLAPHWREDQ
jgi:glycosyltransferase involved in cell wall biosynthesis